MNAITLWFLTGNFEFIKLLFVYGHLVNSSAHITDFTIAGINHFEFYVRQSVVDEPQFISSGFGNIDNSSVNIRAAIIYGNVNRLIVSDIGNPDDGSKWKGFVGRSKLAMSVFLTACRGDSFELIRVKRRFTRLDLGKGNSGNKKKGCVRKTLDNFMVSGLR